MLACTFHAVVDPRRRFGRTLRSGQQRALLYLSWDGKCALCTGDLGEDWEADHIEPWRATHRTNVHEMQPLCRPCNREKG